MQGKNQQGDESYEILKHYKGTIIIKQQGTVCYKTEKTVQKLAKLYKKSIIANRRKSTELQERNKLLNKWY